MDDFTKWKENKGELIIEPENDHVGEYEMLAIL